MMNPNSSETIFVGDSEMASLMRDSFGDASRTHDWSQTPLGHVSSWTSSLKTAVSICLNSRFPMVIWWGKDLLLLYNDAWRPILGTKHPKALGKPGREVWAEIWDIIGVQLYSVLETAQATWSDDMLLPVDRYGYTEEAYFTYSYSPIFLETGEVGGAFTAVTETTRRVIGERRISTLRELAANTVEAKSVEETCQIASATLANNPYDIPFALLYLVEKDGRAARLVQRVRIEAGTTASPEQVDLTQEQDCWNLAQVKTTGNARIIDELDSRLGHLPGGVWEEPSRSAIVLPIAQAGQQEQLAGLLVLGISPRREFDDEYRGFFDLVASNVATAIANARAYEEERKRAEALAELDRAKTIFFSNISHEFRTPLTLMLNPLEDTLAKPDSLAPEDREQLEITYRNSQRLLKLVNTLLDFSRIEAGRIQAVYQPTDLAALTSELASVFRSAIERAGMRLQVDCPPLLEPVYVDREMWEKIVLNLLSNAFKFTFAGEIAVSLRTVDQQIELKVRDTGTGIPAEELPHIFERFHRVKGARGRSYEGSGIGLALVQELVKLHSGTIRVDSMVDQGTCFTVAMPMGFAHLPRECIGATRSLASTAAGALPYIEEMLRWSSKSIGSSDALASELSTSIPVQSQSSSVPSARILLADDNADMRDYLKRLLSQQYEVETVADGIAALTAIRQQMPDLVLTDVMMPGMDGFELLQELRSDPTIQDIPIILLSARAGEEARIEGLEAGADDYLTKPFSARELLARVEANLKLAQLRREATQREQVLRLTAEAAQQKVETILSSISDAFVVLDRDWHFTYVNDRYCEIVDMEREALLGQSVWELFPEAADSEAHRQFQWALNQQTPVEFEWLFPAWNRWFEYRVYPSPDGLTIFLAEITDRKQAEMALSQSEARFRRIFECNMVPMGVWSRSGGILHANDALLDLIGYTRQELEAEQINWLTLTPPEWLPLDEASLAEIAVKGFSTPFEKEYIHKQGHRVPILIGGASFLDDPDSGVFLAVDLTERKQAEEALRQSEEQLRAIFHQVIAGIAQTDLTGRLILFNQRYCDIVGYSREELLHKRMQDITHPDDLPHNLELFHRGVTEGQEFVIEKRYLRKDGSQVWVSNSVSVIRDASGKPESAVAVVLDVTVRKQTEEALRRSEAQLSAEASALIRLNEASSRLWYRLSLNEGLNEMLAATIEMLGADMGNIQILDSDRGVLYIAAHYGFQQDFLDFFREVSATDDSACGRALRAGQRTIIADVEVDAPYAPFRSVARAAGYRAVQSTPLIGRDGALLGILSTHWRSPHQPSEQDLRRLDLYVRQAADFIEHIRAEISRRQSEERYRTLFESIDQGFCIIEMIFDEDDRPVDYRFLITNPAFDRQTGVESAQGKTVREIAPQHEAYWFEIYGNIALTGKARQFENWAEEFHRWYEVYAFRVGEPELKRVGVLFNDITDRKQSEEARATAEQRYRIVSDLIPFGMWEADLQGNATYLSQSFLEMTGQTLEEHRQTWHTLLHPDDTQQAVAAWNECVQTGSLWEHEFRIRGKDGHYRTILARGLPVYSTAGEIAAYVGANYDITERKRAEVALRRSEERLRVSQELSLDAFTILDSVRDETEAIVDFVWTYANPKAAEILKHPVEELVGQRLLEVLPGNELNSELFERYVRVVETGEPHDIELAYNADGVSGWFRNMTVKLEDGVAIFFGDITERKQNELLLIEQKRLLELIATGHSLDECLSAICTSVSMLSLHTRACILLADAQRLTFPCSITPDFPPSFAQGLQDAPINDLCIGTCGEAVYRGEPVTCADIARDDRWSQEWRDLCVAHGVLACHSAPILDLEGLPIGSLMLCFDEARMPNDWEYQLAHFGVQVASLVFERDRASLALRESEARFRGVVESNMVGIVFWDASGCITDGNEMAVQMLGYSQAELQSRQVCWLDITPPEFHEIDAAMQAQLLAEGVCSPFEKAYIRKDGDQVPILIGGALIPGYSDRGVAYFLDITDRKQSEEALRQALQKLNFHVENTPMAVIEWDGELRIIRWSGAAEQIFGWSADEVLGRFLFDLQLVFEEDIAQVSEVSRRLMEEESYVFSYNRNYTQRGDVVHCEWYNSSLRDASGRIISVLSLVLNVTDRVQFERDRERILQQEQAAREAAEAANRIKDEFLAVVSHELRSPLNPILGWSKLLRTRQLDEEKTDRALEVIERNAQMQAQLINDLLDVSRILRGKLSLDTKPVDLVLTIQAAMETVRLAAEAKSIQINTQFEPDIGQVAGDAGRLQQVIWNLLTNAVKFTSEGGRVDIRLERIDAQAQITITDTGKGIPPDFLPYVFEQFRQESSATTRRFGGLGLGLAIVRYLVELHGGTVQADSLGEGQGATFTVKLPLMPHQPITKPDPTPAEFSLNLQGTRILVVDDDDNTREFLAFLLELHGANVIATATAGEALTTLTQFKPDVLLSDIGMPDMDGYMLIRQIRALPPEQGGQVPAIALTAYAGEIDYQQAMAAGFQRHISKPLEPEVLIQAIAALIVGETRE